MEDESPVSVCALHPGVAVTGFCPACLRDRLAGLHPPSADLRRCKSFSNYARSSSSSASYLQVQEEQPHRRSCDARQHPPPVPEDIIGLPSKDHQHESSSSSKAAFGSLGKRWQEWRRKTKLKKQHQESAAASATTTRPTVPLPPESPSGALGRRSCDAFSSRGMLGVDKPRASCDGVSWAPPPPMLFVPRSDDQIPVEEEEEEEAYVPGGSAQTRDYYIDSSSSSRRRRSVDRKSFSSDAGDQLPSRMVAAAANARVSPALVGTEFYHHPQPHAFQYFQPSFEPPPFLGREEATATKSKPKNKGIKGWSIWGLLHKKSSSSSSSVGASAFGGEARATAPELRARGYDGQMLRCNSSVSARSSFSGINGGLGGRMRRADEVLLERNFSARYSSSSSCRYQNQYQFHKGDKDYSNSIANNSGAGAGRPPPPRSSASSSLPRSSLGLYYY